MKYLVFINSPIGEVEASSKEEAERKAASLRKRICRSIHMWEGLPDNTDVKQILKEAQTRVEPL